MPNICYKSVNMNNTFQELHTTREASGPIFPATTVYNQALVSCRSQCRKMTYLWCTNKCLKGKFRCMSASTSYESTFLDILARYISTTRCSARLVTLFLTILNVRCRVACAYIISTLLHIDCPIKRGNRTRARVIDVIPRIMIYELWECERNEACIGIWAPTGIKA